MDTILYIGIAHESKENPLSIFQNFNKLQYGKYMKKMTIFIVIIKRL
jgi:hypothetical protein